MKHKIAWSAIRIIIGVYLIGIACLLSGIWIQPSPFTQVGIAILIGTTLGLLIVKWEHIKSQWRDFFYEENDIDE